MPTHEFGPQTHLSAKARYGYFTDESGLFDAQSFSSSSRETLQADLGRCNALATAYKAPGLFAYVPDRTSSIRSARVGTF